MRVYSDDNSASYDDTLATNADLVRWQLGDSDMSGALVSDAHITAVLALRSTVAATVAALASELIARFALQPVRWDADGLKVDYTGRLDVWRALVSAQGGGGVASGTLTYPAFHPTPTADSITRGWRPD